MRNAAQRIKVVHVVYGLKLAGAERLIADLARLTDRSRYASVVATLTMGGPLEQTLREAGVPVRFMAKRGRYDATVLLRLARLLREERADVVHTHLFGGDVWGRTAAAMAGVPVIVSSLHGVDVWMSAVQRSLERWTARFARRLIAVSEEVKRFYVSSVGVPSEKISVVYNGIDLDRFPAAAAVGKRAVSGVPGGDILVGFAGRLEEEKDLATWLRAARRITESAPGAAFLIAGEGSERRSLEKLSASLGLSGRVRFLGLREDIEEVIAACDIVMFSSRYEGISLALLEAMAGGKAVVTTRVGGNVEVVRDGVNGLLVAPGDETALAAAVLRLAADADGRARLGEEARRTVVERFSHGRWVAGITGIYEEELTRQSRAPRSAAR